jgi:chaperonin GroEL (HSP60 family)
MKTNMVNGKILLIDGGIEHKEMSISASIKITTPGMIDEFKKQEIDKIKLEVSDIAKLGVNMVVCKDGICDEGVRELEKLGIVAYRRVEKKDLELLAKATGATIANNTKTCTPRNIGTFESSRQEKWGSVHHWIVEGTTKKGITLIIKGSSTQIMDIAEGAFNDAIRIACNLKEKKKMLPGGGGSYTSASRNLKSLKIDNIGREQLALDAFAAALEKVPMVLAQNSGLNGLDEMLNLISSQSNLSQEEPEKASWLGLDLSSKTIGDTLETGILDSSAVVMQSIKSSTEIAIAILRIDDVLWARQDPSIPDDIQQSLDND